MVNKYTKRYSSRYPERKCKSQPERDCFISIKVAIIEKEWEVKKVLASM